MRAQTPLQLLGIKNLFVGFPVPRMPLAEGIDDQTVLHVNHELCPQSPTRVRLATQRESLGQRKRPLQLMWLSTTNEGTLRRLNNYPTASTRRQSTDSMMHRTRLPQIRWRSSAPRTTALPGRSRRRLATCEARREGPRGCPTLPPGVRSRDGR